MFLISFIHSFFIILNTFLSIHYFFVSIPNVIAFLQKRICYVTLFSQSVIIIMIIIMILIIIIIIIIMIIIIMIIVIVIIMIIATIMIIIRNNNDNGNRLI